MDVLCGGKWEDYPLIGNYHVVETELTAHTERLISWVENLWNNTFWLLLIHLYKTKIHIALISLCVFSSEGMLYFGCIINLPNANVIQRSIMLSNYVIKHVTFMPVSQIYQILHTLGSTGLGLIIFYLITQSLHGLSKAKCDNALSKTTDLLQFCC